MAGRKRTISDAVRQRIAADVRATIGTPDGATRRVAARHGVSESTVRRIARQETDIPGFGAPETRARMENATAITVRSLADRRATLSEKFIEVAERELENMTQPCVVYNFGGKDNTFETRIIAMPGSADRRNMVIIAATAIDKHKVLDQYDSDSARGNAVDAWLAHMMGGDK